MGYAVMERVRRPYSAGSRQRSQQDGRFGSGTLAADALCDGEAADPDTLEALGDEIATLSAHIAAATHRLLLLIAEFDRLRGWESSGARSCAHWLMERTGMDIVTAREKVRVARALTVLPQTSAAMARGELSFSKVRAVTRAATAESEDMLVELARGTTTAQLERFVRALRKGTREDEARADRARFAARTLSVFQDDDGMYVITGRLMPEDGALVMRGIEAACDQLFGRQGPAIAALPELGVWDAEHRAAAQRRADALGLLAAWALSAGLAGETDAASSAASASPDDGERAAGGEPDGSTRESMRPAMDLPVSGLRAERYQVVVHVEPATLQAGVEPGRSELEDGTRFSAESSRRLCCDASVVRVTHDHDGSILNVGRKTRTIPPALRRALDARDRGCRFPGCGLRFTDAHHVVHWADGGETSLANCLLLCSYHHRLVHEGGWRVQWWGAGRPVFIDPRGGEHFDGRWRAPRIPADAVARLVVENERRGIRPHALTAGARWRREADIPDDVYLRACEVL